MSGFWNGLLAGVCAGYVCGVSLMVALTGQPGWVAAVAALSVSPGVATLLLQRPPADE